MYTCTALKLPTVLLVLYGIIISTNITNKFKGLKALASSFINYAWTVDKCFSSFVVIKFLSKLLNSGSPLHFDYVVWCATHSYVCKWVSHCCRAGSGSALFMRRTRLFVYTDNQFDMLTYSCYIRTYLCF